MQFLKKILIKNSENFSHSFKFYKSFIFIKRKKVNIYTFLKLLQMCLI